MNFPTLTKCVLITAEDLGQDVPTAEQIETHLRVVSELGAPLAKMAVAEAALARLDEASLREVCVGDESLWESILSGAGLAGLQQEAVNTTLEEIATVVGDY